MTTPRSAFAKLSQTELLGTRRAFKLAASARMPVEDRRHELARHRSAVLDCEVA